MKERARLRENSERGEDYRLIDWELREMNVAQHASVQSQRTNYTDRYSVTFSSV